MNQRRNVFGAKRRVAAVDDGLEVVGGDLGARDVEAEDLEGEFGVREVFPVALRSVSAIDSCGQVESIEAMSATQGNALMCAYPVLCGRNLVRQEETPVSGEALEDNGLERELKSQSVSGASQNLSLDRTNIVVAAPGGQVDLRLCVSLFWSAVGHLVVGAAGAVVCCLSLS